MRTSRGSAWRRTTTARIVGAMLVTAAGCGSASSAPRQAGRDSGKSSHDGGSGSGDAGHVDAGVDAGPLPITCANPGTFTMNGSACGVERWAVKTGTDSQAASVSLVPHRTTITALRALAASGGGWSRESPTETTLWELKDVVLTELRLEADSDEHLVLADPSSSTDTMIVEVPYPSCATGSAWLCFITRVRGELDAKYPSISTSPQFPAQVVTVRGVGFFDKLHGQTGVAPNGIELHAVLQICFGQGCTPT